MAVDMDLSALPEGCIAKTLSLTSPKDACRLASVGSTFRDAADSDAVWEQFLPSDYVEILCRSKEGADLLRSFGSKKELYFYLCRNPILIDGGMKSFSLVTGSGKKCYKLAARHLTIVWSEVPRYWRWVSVPESRFSEVAELLDVCWLEIVGKIRTSMLSPDTTYAAYLVFTTKSNAYGLDFHRPAEASVEISGQEQVPNRRVFLGTDGLIRRRRVYYHRQVLEADRPQDSDIIGPQQRDDGWKEVELGEFYVKRGQDEEAEMRLEEVKAGNWKNGIIVEGIEIRPKEGNK